MTATPLTATDANWQARLITAWRAAYPAQARGGRDAMAGFHYQLLLGLRFTVERWRALPAHDRGDPRVFVERLSDILEKDARGLVVTQVKLRQSGSEVRDAMAELWTIWLTARATIPDHLHELHFRVLCARSEVKNLDRAIARWQPEGNEPPGAREAFLQRLKVGLDERPESELLRTLANDLRAEDPLSLVHQWLGVLLGATADPSGFEAAAKRIWSDLHELARRTEHSPAQNFLVWSGEDQAPEVVAPGDFLAGQRPMPRHLRNGFFAPREHIVAPLVEALAGLEPAAPGRE